MPNAPNDPLLRGLDTPLRATYYPLGFPMEVQTNDPWVLAHLDGVFGIFPEAPPQDPPMRIRIACDPVGTEGPPWPRVVTRAYRDFFGVVGGGENYMMCDVARREGLAFFSPALLEDRDRVCTDFIEPFAYMVIQRHWATPVHASCVVRDGVGICMAGGSMSGKSTLAYFCAKSGYQLLSDNAIWLLNKGGDGNLRGNPARPRLRLPACELFPELRSLPVSRRPDGSEIIVPTEEMLRGRLTTIARLGPVVFLDRQSVEGASSIGHVAPEEAHRRLFADRNPRIDEPLVMQECERVIREAVRDGAYAMRYTTLDQALECLDRILEMHSSTRGK